VGISMIKLLPNLLLIFLLSSCAFLNEAQQGWLKNNVEPFQTTKPGSGSSDIAFLKEIVGNAEIVGFGPTMRGIREFPEIKHRIAEYLATNMGYSILAMEIGMAEAAQINGYINGDSSHLKNILYDGRFWPLSTRESEVLLEWMRVYNTSGKGHIEFMGYGMEYMSAAADSVVQFLKKHDPEYAQKAESIYRVIRDQIFNVKNQKYVEKKSKIEYPSTQYAELAYLIRDHMQTNARSYLSTTAVSLQTVRAIQYANVVLQTTVQQLINVKSNAFRDSCMAANVKWIKDHMPSGSKLILWSVNAHLGNKEWSVGPYLKEWYGADNYITIGFKFNKGVYTSGRTVSTTPSYSNTLEWGFHLINIERFMLDLRKASRDDSRTKWLFRDQRTRHTFHKPFTGYGAIGDLYDAVIFIDTVSPSENIR